MTVPSVILVDGMEYAVMLMAASDPRDEDGIFEASKQLVQIRAGLAKGYERSIALHEILHICWEHAGLTAADRPPVTEEEAVTALSYRLLEVLRANPKLVDYLTEGSRK